MLYTGNIVLFQLFRTGSLWIVNILVLISWFGDAHITWVVWNLISCPQYGPESPIVCELHFFPMRIQVVWNFFQLLWFLITGLHHAYTDFQDLKSGSPSNMMGLLRNKSSLLCTICLFFLPPLENELPWGWSWQLPLLSQTYYKIKRTNKQILCLQIWISSWPFDKDQVKLTDLSALCPTAFISRGSMFTPVRYALV